MAKMLFTNVNDFIDWVEHQKRFSPKISLTKMTYFCNLFDNPQNKFKSIHVTGTNGKGSTVAYLNQIYQEAGLHVATYTSPYITCFNERIEYDSQPISDEDLLKYGNQVLSKYDLIINDGYDTPTFFEFITLMAFLYFAELPKLDIAIIEVGMGGRLDATNVIMPLASVITNVSLEHMKVLGPTLEAILCEKLGIVKRNVPLITGVKETFLHQEILERCISQNSKCYFINDDDASEINVSIKGTNFKWKDENYALTMLGKHQISNAICAIQTIKVINELPNRPCYVDDKILKKGLYKTKWLGRLEIVKENPLIIIDGGHNIDGLTKICNYIKELNIKPVRAVVSISADKELKAMVKLLDETFDEIVFSKYTYARSSDAEVLYEMSTIKNKKLIVPLKDTIDYVLKEIKPLTIYIGSLYLVSEIRPLLLALKEEN